MKLQIHIQRLEENPTNGTFGELSFKLVGDNDKNLELPLVSQVFFSLEPVKEGLEIEENLRLPAGIYRLKLTTTSKRICQNRMVRHTFVVADPKVSEERRILVGHVGNFVNDTRGCILYGLQISEKRDCIVDSARAGNEFYKIVTWYQDHQKDLEDVELVISGKSVSGV